jgi:hypothetical protein
MRYGKLNPLFDRHVVTVGEAAYNTLFGLFAPSRAVEWVSGINAPLSLPEEEWLIENFEVTLTNAAGVELRGRILNIFAPHAPGTAQERLPYVYREFPSTSVVLSRPVCVMRGIGAFLRTPSVIATDIIELQGSYRVVHHD